MSAREMELDFTPLIDVTFLLLIFFMVTSTLSQPTEVKLPKAKSGKGEIVADSVQVHIYPEDAENREVRLGDDENAPTPIDMLGPSLSAYPNAVTAMLRADEDVPFAYVDEVAGKLRSAGLGKVVLAVKSKELFEDE